MKNLLLFTLPLMFCLSLSAQITQEEADDIIREHLLGITVPLTVFAKDTVQTNYVVLTSTNEKLKMNYPCWVYYVSFPEETNSKYLIVKESNGNIFEINARNDEGPEDLDEWRVVPDIPHSVWKCTHVQNWNPLPPSYPFFDLAFYPSIGKLIVSSDLIFGSTPLAGVYDYFIGENNRLYIIPDNFGMPWFIIYKSETEMRLRHGNINGSIWYFICLTEFNDI